MQSIQLQVDEIEGLSAIYGNDVTVIPTLETLHTYLDSYNTDQLNVLPPVSVSVAIGHYSDQPLFLEVLLPPEYPVEPSSPIWALNGPSVNELPDDLYHNLCEAIELAVESSGGGSGTVFAVIDAGAVALSHWLERNPLPKNVCDGAVEEEEILDFDSFEVPPDAVIPRVCGTCGSADCLGSDPVELMRVGCFSHHIIAPGKRALIIQLSRCLRLGGVCKTGWPGAIVAEGERAAVQHFIGVLSSLRWKHFVVRAEEITPIYPSTTRASNHGGGGRTMPHKQDAKPLPPPTHTTNHTTNHTTLMCWGADPGSRSEALDRARVFSGFLELPPEAAMGQMAAKCKEAGVEEIFARVLKLRK